MNIYIRELQTALRRYYSSRLPVSSTRVFRLSTPGAAHFICKSEFILGWIKVRSIYPGLRSKAKRVT